MNLRRPSKEPGIRSLGRAYQGAVEATLALVIATVLGAWADRRFDTSPILLFVGLGLGFGTFVLRLVRLLRDLQESPGGDSGPSGER